MDPFETLKLALEQRNSRDYSEALRTLADYMQWRLRGGAEPDGGDARLFFLMGELACVFDNLVDMAESN